MKGKKKIIILGVVVVLIAIAVGAYFFIKYQTYEKIEIVESYDDERSDNANYKQCLDGVLRYSRDGVALLTESGEVVWNQPCQMGTPIVKARGASVAVGDKGGTSIMVFQKNGLKGEIQTTRPIEKMSVSSQGVVSAILKDEEIPLVMCYDAMGNVLVEHKVSVKNVGYPTDVSLSEDGNTLLVSYLYMEGTAVASKIIYYYFGGENEGKTNYQVLEEQFRDTLIPTVSFLDKNTSLLVADNALVFYKGTKKPKQSARVELEKEIQSVAYSADLVAVLLKNGEDSVYKLCVYSTTGKLLSAVDVEQKYSDMRVVDGQVILYDGQHCSIYMKNGVHKYTGNMEENIMEIFPVTGLNKYMMINASGFYEIRLVK